MSILVPRCSEPQARGRDDQAARRCCRLGGHNQKVFDPNQLDTFGNVSGTYNFGNVYATLDDRGQRLDNLSITIENTDGEVLDNYGAFIVFNITKGTAHCFNSTMKMNETLSVPALDDWERTDRFRVIPFVYDSQLPVAGFGTMGVITRPARKKKKKTD